MEKKSFTYHVYFNNTLISTSLTDVEHAIALALNLHRSSDLSHVVKVFRTTENDVKDILILHKYAEA